MSLDLRADTGANPSNSVDTLPVQPPVSLNDHDWLDIDQHDQAECRLLGSSFPPELLTMVLARLTHNETSGSAELNVSRTCKAVLRHISDMLEAHPRRVDTLSAIQSYMSKSYRTNSFATQFHYDHDPEVKMDPKEARQVATVLSNPGLQVLYVTNQGNTTAILPDQYYRVGSIISQMASKLRRPLPTALMRGRSNQVAFENFWQVCPHLEGRFGPDGTALCETLILAEQEDTALVSPNQIKGFSWKYNERNHDKGTINVVTALVPAGATFDFARPSSVSLTDQESSSEDRLNTLIENVGSMAMRTSQSGSKYYVLANHLDPEAFGLDASINDTETRDHLSNRIRAYMKEENETGRTMMMPTFLSDEDAEKAGLVKVMDRFNRS